MPDVILDISSEHKTKTKEEILQIFKDEVEKFSTYMSTIGDWKAVGPLNSSEKALILTYLWQKFNGRLDEK